MVDLIPKQERKPIFGHMFFLIVTVALFTSVVAGFIVLERLEKEATVTRDSLKGILEEDLLLREQQLEMELGQYQSELSVLGEVIEQKTNPAAFFGFLEQTTHPDIFFVRFQGDFKNRTMVLEGVAGTFFALEQQRLAWKDSIGFEDISISSIGIEQNGAAGFKGEFFVSQEFLDPK